MPIARSASLARSAGPLTRLEWLRTGARRAERDPSALEVALFTAAIPFNAKLGSDTAKEIISFYVGGMGDFYRELLSKFGFADDCTRISDALCEQEDASAGQRCGARRHGSRR